MSSARVAVRCPHCAHALTGSAGMSATTQPKPGSASMCFYCGQPSIFTMRHGQLALRHPAPDETAELEENPAYQSAMKIWRDAKARDPLVKPAAVIAEWREWAAR